MLPSAPRPPAAAPRTSNTRQTAAKARPVTLPGRAFLRPKMCRRFSDAGKPWAVAFRPSPTAVGPPAAHVPAWAPRLRAGTRCSGVPVGPVPWAAVSEYNGPGAVDLSKVFVTWTAGPVAWRHVAQFSCRSIKICEKCVPNYLQVTKAASLVLYELKHTASNDERGSCEKPPFFAGFDSVHSNIKEAECVSRALPKHWAWQQ